MQGTLPALALVPFAGLALVLHELPLPWWQAAANSGLLLLMMSAHAACYARWQPGAPRRILVNELLTRLWFAAYAVLLAGLLHGAAALLAVAAAAWALLTWLVHQGHVRMGYVAAANVAQLGLFLLGMASLLVLAVHG